MTVRELVALLQGFPFASDDDVIVLRSATHDWRIGRARRDYGVIDLELVAIDGPQHERRSDPDALQRKDPDEQE